MCTWASIRLTVACGLQRPRISVWTPFACLLFRVWPGSSRASQVLAQDRETPREYIERESHYVWGRRYL